MAPNGKRSSAKAIARQRYSEWQSDEEDDIYDYKRRGGNSLPGSFNPSYGAKFMETRAVRMEPMKPRNANQEKYFELLDQITPYIVVATGSAGTGKTSIAVSVAIQKLRENEYEKIVISRPAVSVAEDLGALPGDLTSKMDPYLQPLYDTFHKYYSPDQVKAMIDRKTIDICPIGYLRGRTFENSFVIIDEAQNTTISQMLMILTRIGKGSKMVITGDPSQHDRGFDVNGLSDLLTKLEKRDVNSVKVVQFTDGDVERHPVIKEILKLYK
jgi:phosphate starvation-inducible PhoH-like protein